MKGNYFLMMYALLNLLRVKPIVTQFFKVSKDALQLQLLHKIFMTLAKTKTLKIFPKEKIHLHCWVAQNMETNTVNVTERD